MHPSQIKQRRIIFVARFILVVIAISAGGMVFYVMKNHAENLLRNSLQSSLENRMTLARAEIEQGEEKCETVATRPFLIRQIKAINENPSDRSAQAALRSGAESFLSTGLSGIALIDQHGREIVRAGNFISDSVLTVPLHLPGHAQLLFQNQFFLKTTIDILDQDLAVGKVIVEVPLPTLSHMFKSEEHGTSTLDLALCASAPNARMLCFPTTLSPRILDLAQISASGSALPMTYALRGQTGFIQASDYRHKEVIAAYGPVDHLGLGMVLKMDSSELYAPVWAQLRYLLPLMLLLLGAALLALRWLLAPLVSELVRSEQQTRTANLRLRDSESRLRLLLDSVDEGIVSISEQGNIELFNPAAERMFRYTKAEVEGKDISMLMPEPDRSGHSAYLQRYLQTGESRLMGNAREVKARRSTGEIFPMEIRVSEFKLNNERKFIGVMHDITERKAIEEKILHLAHYDPLTELPNRRLVLDRIRQTLLAAQRARSQFGVMFMDLNQFKRINDTLGHDVGDRLLQLVANRLTTALRTEDTVARQGGDEFIILLAALNTREDAALVAEKILTSLASPFEINDHLVQATASIGIATYPLDGEDVEPLLKHSDTAMYQAKKTGFNTYLFYSPEMDA